MWVRKELLDAPLDFQCMRAGHAKVGSTYAEPWSIPNCAVISSLRSGVLERGLRDPDELLVVQPGEVSFSPGGRLRRSKVLSLEGMSCGWLHFRYVFMGGHDFLAFFAVPLVFRGRTARLLDGVQKRLAELCREGATMGFSELAEVKIEGFKMLEAILAESPLREGSEDMLEDLRRLDGALRHIRENFRKTLDINVLSRQACMSRTQLHARFQSAMGMAPMRYLRSLRMEKAKDLLLTTTMTVGEIASAVGYDDQMYFSRVFRSMAGASPTDYRKRSGTVES